MSNTANALTAPANAPQQVTWWLVNYYSTDADGQVASVIGIQFKTENTAVQFARDLITANSNVGVCYIQQVQGLCVYPLYDPVPS